MDSLRIHFGTPTLPYCRYTPIVDFLGNNVFELSIVAYWNIKYDQRIVFDVIPKRIVGLSLSVNLNDNINLQEYIKTDLLNSMVVYLSNSSENKSMLFSNNLDKLYYASIYDDIYAKIANMVDIFAIGLEVISRRNIDSVHRLKGWLRNVPERYLPTLNTYLDEVLDAIADERYKNKKVELIQKTWKVAISCPTKALCRMRLLREFDELMW